MRVGNHRKVQKLSHHRQLDTLMIYDDNRGSYQQEVTGLLDDKVFEGAIVMTQAKPRFSKFEEYLSYVELLQMRSL